ncbi:unnamed protein product [Tuber aestivum]|uniref:GH18 domain-containing protein n=1 Tax=Tuber aestivum TaxID=59557 RepID=A0A292PQE0_9PEZI|nr:unnamed protein product [Tuber aestivum]
MPPPPLPPRTVTSRIVLYHQTHYTSSKEYVSILPLLTENTGTTHVILAAIHLNDPPGNIHLNETSPDDAIFETLWDEVLVLQDSGIKVLGMLGGAARGSFERLDGSEESFEAYYCPLRDMIHKHKLNGLDLDVEEEMSLKGVIRLIDRLKADFGQDFLITLAPVATGLINQRHLSGFDYRMLEVQRGGVIDWYNVQFYCGWGSMEDSQCYDLVMAMGWPPEKVVAGVVTNAANGSGWVEIDVLVAVFMGLVQKYPGFGGVMGWEYFNAMPGGLGRPWEWAENMASAVAMGRAW